MSTNQVPVMAQQDGFEDHLSVANDAFMPDIDGAFVSPTSVPGTSTLEVFDTYVDVYCWLGELPLLEEEE